MSRGKVTCRVEAHAERSICFVPTPIPQRSRRLADTQNRTNWRRSKPCLKWPFERLPCQCPVPGPGLSVGDTSPLHAFMPSCAAKGTLLFPEVFSRGAFVKPGRFFGAVGGARGAGGFGKAKGVPCCPHCAGRKSWLFPWSLGFHQQAGFRSSQKNGTPTGGAGPCRRGWARSTRLVPPYQLVKWVFAPGRRSASRGMT